jgi:integrase/recombinase XerD
MPTKAPPKSLADLLQSFFCQRLQSQQALSSHTLASYRDTFRLLLRFMESLTGRAPSQQRLADWTNPRLLQFLEFVEKKRGCTVRTRNQRLAALRSFMRYVAQEEPSALAVAQRALAIPMKRFDRPLLGYLTDGELKAILAATDPNSASGRRDHLLLSLLYNSGARVSEILALQRQHVHRHPLPHIQIQGKGRKERTLPLWESTAQELQKHLAGLPAEPATLVFTNHLGQGLTRFGALKRLRWAVQRAMPHCPSLRGRRISPHTLRHTTAMHLLQSGAEITSIALLLGHASPATTHQYVELDLEMKERALAQLRPAGASLPRFHPDDCLLSFLDSFRTA